MARMRLFTVALACVLTAACGALPADTPSTLPSTTATQNVSPTPSDAPTPTPSARPTASPSASPGFVSYTVAGGDTLFHIASTNATSWQSLIFWNKGRFPSLDPADPSYDPDRLEVGWQLVLIPGVTVDYEPTPGGTATPTVEPTAGGPSIAVRNGDRASTMVALTFDMGGRVTPAVDIMALLVSRDIKATIFPTGAILDSTNADAGRKVLAIVADHRELFALGNHSYTHPDFRSLDQAAIVTELRRMEAAVSSRSNLDPRPLFRPPYGTYDARVLAAVGSAGYGRTILWDVDSIDWKPESEGGPTTSQIVAKVRNGVRGGSIVLFHLGGYNTLDALPAVLDAIAAKGLRPVTMPELLGL